MEKGKIKVTIENENGKKSIIDLIQSDDELSISVKFEPQIKMSDVTENHDYLTFVFIEALKQLQ